MATAGLPVERLRQYLRQLPPAARALLIAELERALLRGEDIPGGDFLLNEVRSAVRESGQPAPRIGHPARLFFRPLERFLIDDDPARKHQARIARASLEPLWSWIVRDLAPAEAKIYSEEVARALAANDAVASERRAHAFQDQVVERIRSTLAAVRADDKARRRMIGQIGTPNALDDAGDLLTILAARDVLAMVDGRLPGHIRNLADERLDDVKAMVDSTAGLQRELLPYALILVMGRLAAPWQLIRLAVKAADSDDVGRIAGTPYAAAVTITLAEIERMVAELKADLKRGAAVAVTSLLKCIHDTARGLRTELDLSGDSPWARRLAAIRAEISSVLKAEIESMPGRVRRLLRPRPSNEIARGSVLDPDDVAETEVLIEFVGACRNYAGELAISEMTLRTYREVQQYLDTGTQALLDGLRHAGEADRTFRQSQVDAAVRCCAKVFGKEYASLLTKAAEVAAAHSDRRAMAKA